MTRLRSEARGRDCSVRVPGVCNHNPETVVLAHLRLQGISGMGLKANDFLGAHCCSSCHTYCDTHHDAETKVMFYEGIFRTQAALLRERDLHL